MLAADVLENLVAATGFSRQTVRDAFSEIETTFGNRLSVMGQRIGGIVANASASGGDGGLEEVIGYTDEVVTPVDRSKLYMGLGLGFIGGLVWASAAGEIIVILVALACLIAAGMLVKSFLTSLMDRASNAIDVF